MEARRTVATLLKRLGGNPMVTLLIFSLLFTSATSFPNGNTPIRLLPTNHQTSQDCPPCKDSSHLLEIDVVFSNHLDIGFTKHHSGRNGAATVLNTYFYQYFPWAMETAQQIRQAAHNSTLHVDDSYIYMTHPFLLSLFFDCPPNMGFRCPTYEEQNQLKRAIDAGDITYHAAPFNYDPEMALSDHLIDFSFKHTHIIDDYLGQTRKTVISQRDVPSLTINTIPIAAKNKIRALSIGVNEGSAPVVFPANEPFIWKLQDDLITFYHPGGYGLSNRIQYLPNCPYGVVWAWETDNARPHTAQQVREILANLRARYPPGKVRVRAATLETVVDKFERCRQWMKTVENTEAGDTWIYGVPSDPWKTAAFRHLSHYLEKLPVHLLKEEGVGHLFTPVQNFSRLLMFNLEHTWGGDCSWYLGDDYYKWWPRDFDPMRGQGSFRDLSWTWSEQRAWGLHYAVDALKPTPYWQDAIEILNKVMQPPTLREKGEWTQDDCFQGQDWKMCLSQQSSISHLEFFSDVGSRIVASPEHQLGRVEYREMEDAEFGIFGWAYMSFIHLWFGFGKVGLPPTRLPQRHFPKRIGARVHGNVVEVQAVYPSECYACPREITIRYTVKHESVKMEFIYRDKKPTRMPDSLSIVFDPILPSHLLSVGQIPLGIKSRPQTWHVDKIGGLIDTETILTNGSQHIHGFSGGFGMPNVCWISTLDAGVVLIGNTSPLPIPLQQGSNSHVRGAAVNLLNNAWGTNFPQWYPFEEQDTTGYFDIFVEFGSEALKRFSL
jgi:hypothetical protein